MTVSIATRLTVPPDVLISIVDGEAVLLNLKSERYFGLNRTGTAMWSALTTAESVETALEQLKPHFAVDQETLRHDVVELIGELIEHGLLEASA